MHPNDTTTPQRRQDDWFQRPAAPLQWEAPKRRADDFIPPDRPLDWSDTEQPELTNESTQ